MTMSEQTKSPAAAEIWDRILKKIFSPEDETPVDDSRRHALRTILGAAAGMAAMAVPLAASAAATDQAQAPENATPHKWGMAIDLDRCTGCGGCTVACRTENNVPTADPAHGDDNRGIYWMDMLISTKGSYPHLETEMMPIPCMHCEDAPCVKVCPVGATFINEEGIVAQIWDRCIGCRYCQSACPYSRRYFNWETPEFPESLRSTLNPDVATRPRGVVEKCTFCHHRVRKTKEHAKAEAKTLTDADFQYLPACAQACPAKAITFGDLNDPESEVSRLHENPRATRLLEELGTKPKVVYLRETKWRE